MLVVPVEGGTRVHASECDSDSDHSRYECTRECKRMNDSVCGEVYA